MNPIKELETLRTKTHQWNDVVLKAGENRLSELKGDLVDLEVEFAPAAGAETVFDLRGIKVTYDFTSQKLTCGDHEPASTKLEPVQGVIRLRILLDRTSMEVFGNDGRVYIPVVVFPEPVNLTWSATCANPHVSHFLSPSRPVPHAEGASRLPLRSSAGGSLDPSAGAR